MGQLFTLDTLSYIEQQKVAQNIEIAAKKIDGVAFFINPKNENYYKLQIQKPEKRLPKEYGEYILAVMEFMIPTLKEYNSYQEFNTYHGKKYQSNAIIHLDDCEFLLGEFLEVFMPLHPEFIYVGENEDNAGNLAIYTPAHLRAGKALNKPDWPWINPDKLLEEYYKLS